MVAALRAGQRIVLAEPERYAAMAAAARATMRAYCGDEVVAAALRAFLGLSPRESAAALSPSPLMRDLGAS